jgi:hypothetical protein
VDRLRRSGRHLTAPDPNGNSPKNLPDGLAQLKETYHAAHERVDALGVDAFLAREPHLVAMHRRSFQSQRFADELRVFANGVLDHRVTSSDAKDQANGDSVDPRISLEKVATDALAGLRTALADLDRNFVLALSPDPGDHAKTGTTHLLAHAGAVPRIRAQCGHPLPNPLRPVVAALAELRRRFDVPPDEA